MRNNKHQMYTVRCDIRCTKDSKRILYAQYSECLYVEMRQTKTERKQNKTKIISVNNVQSSKSDDALGSSRRKKNKREKNRNMLDICTRLTEKY